MNAASRIRDGRPGEALYAVVKVGAVVVLVTAAALTELRDEFRFRTRIESVTRSTSASNALVAIPAYNEEEAIREVVETASEYASEVLVVDDGSTDRTAARAREAGAIVVGHPENRGYGAALKTAFEAADTLGADSLVLIDGDGQHDATDIPKLVDTLRETDADIVIGSRFASDSETEMPRYRRFGVETVNVLTNLSLGIVRPRCWVRDTQSGFRAYDDTAIASLAADDGLSDCISASTDILYHAHQQGYEIAEVGTTIDYDVADANNHNPLLHGFALVSNILKRAAS